MEIPAGFPAPATGIHRLGAVASTQDEAAARLRDGQEPPFALTATRQTSGRGRLGRAFSSPDGASLALTYVHRTALPPDRRGWFPLAAGLAAVAALERTVPARDAATAAGTAPAAGDAPAAGGAPADDAAQRIGLKWPNDLHTADGRKLGGILVEARGTHDLLLGIGLNLRGPVLDADGEPVPGATWLRGPDGLRPDGGPDEDARLREALEEALVRALAEELGALESSRGDGDAAGTRRRYTMTCLTLGRAVRIDPLGESAGGGDRDPALRGTARDIDGHGRLVLDLGEGGREVAVDVGDVRHLRPEASAPCGAAAPPDGPGAQGAAPEGAPSGDHETTRHEAEEEQESGMEKRGPAR